MNEVEIVITGHDRSGKAFDSAKARAQKFRKDMSDVAAGTADDFDAAGDKIEKDMKASFDKVEKDAHASLDKVASAIESRISSAMMQVQKVVTERLTVVEHESERHGSRIGGGLVSGIRSAFSSGATKIRIPFDKMFGKGDTNGVGRGFARSVIDDISAAFKGSVGQIKSAVKPLAENVLGSLKSVFSGPTLMPMIIATLVGAAAALAPMLGNLVSGALLGALGVGLAGVAGFIAVKLNLDGIKDKFKGLGKDLEPILANMVRPIVPVLETVIAKTKEVAGKLGPEFGVGFKIVQDSLGKFAGTLIEAFEKLEPAIRPGAQAFKELLDQIGPRLPGVFENISDAIINLSGEISKDKDMFATLFEGLLNLLPLAINMFSGLMDLFGRMRDVFLGTVSAMGTGVSLLLTGVEKILGAFRLLGQAISLIPGMQGIGQALVRGIDDALGKIHEFQSDIANMQTVIKVTAEIRDLQNKISIARTLLADPEISKERRAQINADITKLQAKVNDALLKLGNPKLIAERRASITAEISRLEANLKTAKAHLNDKDLTKDRKASLKADISQLQTAIKQARKALNDLNGKTATTYVITKYLSQGKGGAGGAVAGGAGGGARASGGVAGGMVLVGEQGPEIVELPQGSMVRPAGRTRSMLKGYASGGVVSAPKAAPYPGSQNYSVTKTNPKLTAPAGYMIGPGGELYELPPSKKSSKPQIGTAVSVGPSIGTAVSTTAGGKSGKQIGSAVSVGPSIGYAVSTVVGPVDRTAEVLGYGASTPAVLSNMPVASDAYSRGALPATPSRSGGGSSPLAMAMTPSAQLAEQPLTHAVSRRGTSGALTINVYVSGSIRSDKDIVQIIRDEMYRGGFRGALTS
ncbi:hypothetical protein J5X84_36105 [Streptosporangiaceae bacterium NEAU-GS5]|nr:hypothetical protein [Streptosporangiaceae bacterium NEAU-GS5]